MSKQEKTPKAKAAPANQKKTIAAPAAEESKAEAVKPVKAEVKASSDGAAAAVKAAKPVKKKRGKAALESKKALKGWIFVLPFVIGLVAFLLPVIIDSAHFSFTKLTPGLTGYELEWMGLKNYYTALVDDINFYNSLVHSISAMFAEIPTVVIFSLFMAVILSQKIHGRGIFRAIFFIPVILSTGIISRVDATSDLLNSMANTSTQGIDTGAGNTTSELVESMNLEAILSNMQIGGELANFVIAAVDNIYNVVNRSGVQMLIFLAGLQSISPSIYESAQMEGATGWETFWKITFPMISPMIFVNTIYTIIDSFTAQSNSVMNYIQANGFDKGDYGLGSAMSWIYFIVVAAFTGILAFILSRFIFYQQKD